MQSHESKAVRDELAAIRRLPTSDGGPIADTYERLQGIAILRAAAPTDKIDDEATRIFLALAQSEALLLFNISHLLRRATTCFGHNSSPRFGLAAYHLQWAYALARTCLSLNSSRAGLFPRVRNEWLHGEAGTAHLELHESLAKFDSALDALARNPRSNFVSIIRSTALSSDASMVIQVYKSFCQTVRIILDDVAIGVRPEVMQADVLRQAVHSLDTKIDSYLMQFRACHQVPEILAPEAATLIQRATNDLRQTNHRASARRLRLANIAFHHINESLWPLIDLMYPVEYHKIRKHLGKTSGSSSPAIAKNLITQSYVDLSSTFHSVSAKYRENSDLFVEMARLQRHVYQWRDVHMMLPRNVLGSETTSLIGSRNAPSQVREWRDKFRLSDPLAGSAPVPTMHWQNQPGEEAVLEATGAVTRKRFADVENRTGFYSETAQK